MKGKQRRISLIIALLLPFLFVQLLHAEKKHNQTKKIKHWPKSIDHEIDYIWQLMSEYEEREVKEKIYKRMNKKNRVLTESMHGFLQDHHLFLIAQEIDNENQKGLTLILKKLWSEEIPTWRRVWFPMQAIGYLHSSHTLESIMIERGLYRELSDLSEKEICTDIQKCYLAFYATEVKRNLRKKWKWNERAVLNWVSYLKDYLRYVSGESLEEEEFLEIVTHDFPSKVKELQEKMAKKEGKKELNLIRLFLKKGYLNQLHDLAMLAPQIINDEDKHFFLRQFREEELSNNQGLLNNSLKFLYQLYYRDQISTNSYEKLQKTLASKLK